MDNMFGSRWLIDELSKLGFTVSHQEVRCYKQSDVENDDSLNSLVSKQPECSQWVVDNIDHNTATLDGKNTFHGMGIIAVSIGNGSFSCKRIPRGKQKLPSETTAGKAIKIQQYLQNGKKKL